MRRTSTLVSSVVSVAMISAVLVGCSASPDDASACTPLIAAGEASKLVSATGAVGSAPSVDIPAPLISPTPERSVIEAGEGLVAQEGMTVDYDAILLDGETGQLVQQTSFDGVAHPTRAGGGGAMWDAFVCAQAGDRIAVTSTIGDSGLARPGAPEADLARPLVLVIDIHGVYLGKADGINQLPQDGMPVVVTAPDGTVGLTAPSGLQVPTSDRAATIKLGSGEELAEGDEVVLQLGVDLERGWRRRLPALHDVELRAHHAHADQDDAQSLPGAVFDALLGAPVGSQLLVVVAPEAEGSDASVFVVDVLGIRTPAAK